MRIINQPVTSTFIAAALLAVVIPAHGQSTGASAASDLAAEIEALRNEYEARLKALESQLSALEAESKAAEGPAATPARREMPAPDNVFNPAISAVLNGMFTDYSRSSSEIPGFQTGHESERAAEGLSLGHSEIALSSNIDDKFQGALTLGLGVHPGERAELEIEEAYIRTLPGMGLPDGMRLQAGRALWTFGYLNELHAHADDFSDRPLPYRAYLDNAFNDDGLELSVVLPSDLYTEVGGGLFRGDDLPFGGSERSPGAWSAFARIGGDIGSNSAWRMGGYLLGGRANGRGGDDGHAHGHGEMEAHGHEEEEEHGHDVAHEEDEHHEDEHHEEDEHAHMDDDHEEHGHHDDHAVLFSNGMFSGNSRLFGVDFRYTLAPTGNARERELILQGEYFLRKERGTYAIEEEHPECTTVHEEDGAHRTECGTHTDVTSEMLDGTSSGWYLQGVYKFAPQLRVGARYSRLESPRDSGLDHDPSALALMFDWTNSEFSRLRLQYNRESLGDGEHDDQIMLQYIMSLGAHAAHTF